jgi:hypothetical protein
LRTDVVKDVHDLLLEGVALVLVLLLNAVLLNILLGLHGVQSMTIHERKQVILVLGGDRVSDTVTGEDTLQVDVRLAVLVTLDNARSKSRNVDSCEGLTRDVKLTALELGIGGEKLGQEDKVIVGSLAIAGVIIRGGLGVGKSNTGGSPGRKSGGQRLLCGFKEQKVAEYMERTPNRSC